MNTITEVVNERLDAAGLSSYRTQVDPIVGALEQRESEIVDGLLGEARELGLDSAQAREVLRSAGLNCPEPTLSAVPEDSDTDARLSRMEASIERLMQVARDRGLLR